MKEGGGFWLNYFLSLNVWNIRNITAIEWNLKIVYLLTYMRIFDVLYEIPQGRKSDPAAIKFTDIY